MSLLIQKINEEQLELYTEIKIQIWKECYNNILPNNYLNSLNIKDKVYKYRKDLTNGSFTEFFIIFLKNTPIGVFRINYYFSNKSEYNLCIKDLYILLKYRNMGFGVIVFKFIMNLARLNQCKYITAWIIKNNTVANDLANRIGFKKTSKKNKHKKTGVIMYEYQYKL